ncbi:low molecular weight phosphotyrosine protein phosphatase [Rhizobium sp. KAs_5_22]|uniref:low molecular weight protein-tyrosine-phosphatase n=1 Tax=Ciceribacter selenitireducens TaxID=448181 RepID=UPI0009FD10C3|nr:low molecular weight protein-tyrosine-phosphatase [Ciceribacter selenitireducens]PPJ45235.1 low molecular weight phosphotyrosine protein phosphatase [Rhizobium sp. KAs_5_22]
MTPFPVLFVCLGNICRSPLAEGIFRHLTAMAGSADLYPADSAGTGGWHNGHPPDSRSVQVAREHGIDISDLRARRVEPADFHRFELILAMDRNNLRHLQDMAPPKPSATIALFSAFALGSDIDVPDPYYGGIGGFRDVYSMLFSGCRSIVAKLEAERASCSGNTSSVK